MIPRKFLAAGGLTVLTAGLLTAPAAMADTPSDRCTIHEVTMSSTPADLAWEVTTDAKIVSGDDATAIREAEDALAQGLADSETTITDLRDTVQAAETAVASAQETVSTHPVTRLQAELDAALSAGEMYPVVAPGESASHTFDSPVSTWDVEAVVIAGEGGGGGGGSQDPAAKKIEYQAPPVEGIFDLVTDTGEELRFISTAYESIRVTAFTGPGGSGIKADAIDQDGTLAKAKDELTTAKGALSSAQDELDSYLDDLDALVDAWMAAQGGDTSFSGLDSVPADADELYVVACGGETVTVDYKLTDIPDGYEDPGKISMSVTGGSDELLQGDVTYRSAFGESVTGQVALEQAPDPDPEVTTPPSVTPEEPEKKEPQAESGAPGSDREPALESATTKLPPPRVAQ